MTAATLRQCIIHADEPAQMLAQWVGRPFLAWQLRELSRFGVRDVVIDCPDLTDAAIDALHAIAASLPRPMGIAVTRAHSVPIAARVLTCDAGRLFDGSLAVLLADAARDPAGSPGRALYTTDGRPTGLAVMSDPTTASGATLSRSIAPGRVIDAASPGPGFAPRPALFLDRDGTLNVDHGYVGTRARFDWIAGAREAVARATGAGWHVFIVTNQSGIARGFYDAAAVDTLHDWLADEVRQVGGTVDDVRFCPYHPKAPLPAWRRDSDWRKPGAGMLRDLIRAWELDPRMCRMVGDQPTDVAAAEAAGVQGHLFTGGDLDALVGPLLAVPAAFLVEV